MLILLLVKIFSENFPDWSSRTAIAGGITLYERNRREKKDFLIYSAVINVMNGNELDVLLDGNRLIIKWHVKLYKKFLLSCYFEKPFSCFQWQMRIFRFWEKESQDEQHVEFKTFQIRAADGMLVISGFEREFAYFAELGILLPGNKFFPVSRSEIIQFFPHGGSWKSPCHRTVFEPEERLPEWRKFVSTYTLYDGGESGWNIKK